MKTRPLDDVDLKILALLQQDGRMTNRDLAAKVALSPSPCLERVRRLEAAGFIEGYRALIAVEKLYQPVLVLAELTLDHQGKGRQAQVEERLLAEPSIIELLEVSGVCDYIAKFLTPSIAAYQRITAAMLDDPGLGLERIVSHIVMREVRKAGALPLALED